ncbi:MAG: TrkH family potassium uptake protein [Clostridia bacterium]|nr:TrkH family potassium uptake protein [Clostridia bacterium]
MNYRLTIRILSYALLTEAALLLLPLSVAFYYHENPLPFMQTLGLLVICGGALRLFPVRSNGFYAREGFVAVALTWIAMSAFGALPFVLSGEIPHYVDALFETVSGFTTTGASILSNVEAMSKGLLFWRSFTHWIGGMGVLVFILAVLPTVEDRSIHIMRAEVPGPLVSKLVPRTRNTAAILYRIYIVMTLLQMGLLMAGGMPAFDAAVHTFGTAGTGGFGSKNNSIAYYNSAYIDIVIGVFMVLFSINFNLYFLLLLRQFKSVFKNEELRYYLCIIAAVTLVIAVDIYHAYGGQSLRYAFFQVSSIISTTGFSTANFSAWPQLSRNLLLGVMFIGGCAGGTGGGLKVSRCIILAKSSLAEIHHMLHPRSIRRITLDEKPVANQTIHGTLVFFALYMAIIMVSLLLVSLDNFDFTSTFSGVLACISNIGPGLDAVGPAGNYGALSYFSKCVLSMDMLLGRLEIFPVIVLFSALRRRG